MVSHIIGQFPSDTRFVVACGHLSGQLKGFLSLAHPQTQIEYVDVDPFEGPGSGPGRSLLCCRPNLPGPFVFTACDTLIGGKLPRMDGNWLGVMPVDDPSSWCTLGTDKDGLVTDIAYKRANGHRLAFVGLGYVHDIEAFWEALAARVPNARGELQVDPGLEAMAARGCRIEPVDWTDTGTVENYLEALSRLGPTMSFEGKSNDLTFQVGDQIIKLFRSESTALSRYERGLAHPDCFAAVTERHGQLFGTRRVEGALLADVATPDHDTRFLSWMQRAFWRDHDTPVDTFRRQMSAFYGEKTRTRLRQFLDDRAWGREPACILAGNVPIPTVDEVLSTSEGHWLHGGWPSSFHGDLHDENVLVTEDGHFVLIDWREDFAGDPATGDRYYDLAKYYHTLDLSVATMRDRDYAIEETATGLEIRHKDTPILSERRRAFWRFVDDHGYDRRRIAFLNGLIFVNMAPLYKDPMSSYLYFLGRKRLSEAVFREPGDDV